MEDRPILETSFNGLSRPMPSLPAKWYTDPQHFAREMTEIWSRNWVYLCRADALEGPQAFRTFEVAGQPILILRDKDEALRGFFNTCRHRGSILCKEASGTFKKPIITCPYHQWAYDMTGRLRAIGAMRPVEGFDRADYPLLPISVTEWSGFVFANLDAKAGEFDLPAGGEAALVANWPLDELKVGHSYKKRLACNWKLFWENFNECLHCPNIHPELSALVPIYGRAIMAREDDPDWASHADDAAPHRAGTLREGAQSWSMDGMAQGCLPGLTGDDLAAGQRYVTSMPSVFIAHHADYVRSVRITPLSAEEMELSVDWLFHPDQLARPDFDMARIVDFGVLVMEQDGGACELNQAGQRSAPFTNGVLMQEEYDVFHFHEWVRSQLSMPSLA